VEMIGQVDLTKVSKQYGRPLVAPRFNATYSAERKDF